MKRALILLLFLLLAPVSAFAESQERINIYYKNGVTYLKDKKYSSAISEFKKVIRQMPYDDTVRNSLATAYYSRAHYYANSENAHKKAINDLRSSLLYFKYWDGAPSESKRIMAQQAEDTLKAWKDVYAPLKNPDAVLSEAKALRAQGELAASLYEYRSLFTNSKYGIEAYSTASDIYKTLNNDKMAINCIRDAILNKKTDGMLHFKYALILDDIGNEDAAMDEYSKALEYSDNNQELLSALTNLWMARSVQNPSDSQALINLGAILQKQGKYELARNQYIKARQINPNDPVVLINLASVYTAENDYNNALKIYDEMLLKDKTNTSARYYKANLYQKQGNIQSAIKEYREILAIKPNDPDAENAMNSLLSNLSGEELSAYLYSEAQKNPKSYDAQFKYAFEMHKNKSYPAAIEYYKKAISIDSKHSEPYINLAQIYLAHEDFPRAENVINKGLSIFSDNQDLKNLKDTFEKTTANQIYNKAAELYDNKNYQGALQYYLKITYQTPEILSMIANCYYEIGDNTNALNYYKKVIEKDPKNEYAYLMAANLLINSKKNDDAIMYLNKLLAVNPANEDAKNTLKAIHEGQEGTMLNAAIGLYESKKYDNALDVLNKVLSQNPKNAYAYYYKGAIAEEKGDPKKALSEYKNAIKADSKFSLGYYMIAVAYDNLEEYNDAVSYYEKYIKLKAEENVEDEYTEYAKSRTKELKEFLTQK